MSTQVRREETPAQPPQLVEMSWDPMTRIVGSLGIYTKIDFKNRRIAEAFSTSHIFRGFAMSKIDENEAHETMKALYTMGEVFTDELQMLHSSQIE